MVAVNEVTSRGSRAVAGRSLAPAELRAFPQWVLWRWEERAGGPTKAPCSARTRTRTDVRDPKGWSTYAKARRVLRDAPRRFAGLGFVFTALDPFCGIDLDNSLDPNRKVLRPWARAIVDRLATYAEVSPSGRGVKLFLRGCLADAAGGTPVRHCRRGLGDDGRGSIELYDERRFFTVTGERLVLRTSLRKVAHRHAELTALYRELFPPPAPHPDLPPPRASADDDTILRRATAAANGAKFLRLWAGDASAYGGDESARDAALCACLAFYTRDPKQIERLVFRSGCRRPKWEQRSDYRERTVRFVLRAWR
jgi:primase-polymerase (primpol)-like protein